MFINSINNKASMGDWLNVYPSVIKIKGQLLLLEGFSTNSIQRATIGLDHLSILKKKQL